MRPFRISAAVLLALPASPLWAGEAATTTDRCPAEAVDDRLGEIRPGGELLLASGRTARLVDLRIDDREGERAFRLLRSFAGEPVRVRAVAAPDRWGRVPALVETAGPAPVGFAELLVGEGFAVVDAGERDDLCRPDLLRVEEAARRGRAGLWKVGAGPIRADDRAALESAQGRFGIVEGRVISVGERRDRTYLNFGRDWSRDFAVTLRKRSWAAAKASGLSAAALTGARVRVRGLIEMRRAPGMEIDAHALVEVLEPGRSGEAQTKRPGGAGP